MAKWAVIYSSITGNTEKVARAVAVALENADCFPVASVPNDLSKYDGIALGYWLWRGGPDGEMQKLMSRIENRPVFLFATHATQKGSEHAVTALARGAAVLGRGCTILATFECQGELAPELVEKRRQRSAADPHANTGGWLTAFGHPDEDDLTRAQAAAEIAERKLAYFLKKEAGKK